MATELINPYRLGAALPAPTVTSIVPATGSANGSPVTIHGTNLTGATSVAINDAECSSVVIAGDGLSLTAVSPVFDSGGLGNPSVFDVRVDTPGGTNTLAAAFTVQQTGIDSIVPNSGTSAGGVNSAIAGWGFTNWSTTPPVVTFGADAMADANPGTDIEITGHTPAHAAGVVTITITFDNGPTATLVNGYTFT